jgi:hypothetical protein
MPAVSPLFFFHARAGARLALRALVPVIAAVVGGWMLLGSDFLNSLSDLFYGPGAGLGAAGAMTVALAGAAGVAAPRVCQGAAGWLRHLPASGRAHRRAAALALAVAQIPLLLLFCVLVFGAWLRHGSRPLDLVALPVLAFAAALLVLPLERPLLTRILALACAAAVGTREGLFVLLGAALLVAADLAAGPLAVVRPRPRRGRSGGSWLPWRLIWRALELRLFGAYAAGLLPLALAGAFASHNQLAPREQRLGAVLGGVLALVMFLAQAAESLAVRRPVWPWARSLPWTSTRRVAGDALFLGGHALPFVLLAGTIDPLGALAVLAVLPPLAALAAGALPRAPEHKAGAAGEVMLAGAFAAAAVALLPWLAPVLLAATPLVLRTAAARDRACKVSRWQPLHHLSAGDSQSGSGG